MSAADYEPQEDDIVIDRFRQHLYGETTGRVLRPMGPYRSAVKWPDERGEQIEKNADLEKVDG